MITLALMLLKLIILAIYLFIIFVNFKQQHNDLYT